MIEVTIEQMNEAIARFMGGVKQIIPKGGLHGYKEGTVLWMYLFSGNADPVRSLEYNTSWDWLMPVVEKINTLKEHNPDGKNLRLMSQLTVYMEMCGYYRKCRCSILGNITHCYTKSIPHSYETVELPSIFVHDKGSLIEAVNAAVYQFITWYNQQKQNNG